MPWLFMTVSLGAQPLVLRVERRFRDDRGAVALAEDRDLELAAVDRECWRHHGERQRFADAPAEAARGGATHELIAAIDRLRAARIGVGYAVHLHGHELVLEAAPLPVQQSR